MNNGIYLSGSQCTITCHDFATLEPRLVLSPPATPGSTVCRVQRVSEEAIVTTTVGTDSPSQLILNPRTNQTIQRLKSDRLGETWALEVISCPDFPRIVSIDNDATGVLWNAHTGEIVADLPSSLPVWVRSLKFWNQRLYVCGRLGSTRCSYSIQAYDLETCTLLHQVRDAHAYPAVLSPTIAPEEGWLFSASRDKSLKVWSGRTKVAQAELSEGASCCYYASDLSLVFVGVGRWFLFWVEAFDVRKLGSPVVTMRRGGRISNAGIVRIGPDAFVACANRTLSSWNSKGKVLREHKAPGDHHGICTIGSGFDERVVVVLGDPAMEERIGYLMSGIVKWCVVCGGVRVTRGLLMECM